MRSFSCVLFDVREREARAFFTSDYLQRKEVIPRSFTIPAPFVLSADARSGRHEPDEVIQRQGGERGDGKPEPKAAHPEVRKSKRREVLIDELLREV